jgi:tRNA(fMet)-specific endonuclease VapC
VSYVLDTNVVAALMRPEERILQRLERMGRDAVTVPQPVFAEIEFGVRRLPRSKRRRLLEGRLALVREELSPAAWTDDVSAAFGDIKAALQRRGEPIEDFDIAIAAHAFAQGATLVTWNDKHMSRIPGIMLEDWS